MRKTRSQTQSENAMKNQERRSTSQQNQPPPPSSGTIQQVPQKEIDKIKNMIIYFRLHELRNLLAAFNVPRIGRKSELQKRALDLLKVNFVEVANKIKEIDRNSNYKREVKSSHVDLGAPDSKRIMYQPQMQLPIQPDVRAVALAGNNLVGGNLVVSFANNITQGYPIHPDVRLKKLAFYDVIATLLRPSTLVPSANLRMQEATFFFTLTPQQATEIATNRDIRNGSKIEHATQVQLRFCLLETSCEQDDCFPSNIVVKVNQKLCPLPNPIPTNRPNVEPKRPPRPVNVTPNVKLSPTVTNNITVQWSADYTRGYVVSAYLVKKLTSQQLLTRMKTKGVKSPDHTRALIKDKLKEDADCEIATTMLKVSLMCPLGKMRMTIPCRASTCSHLQCFDASLYLQMNERKPTWNCPVCDKPAIYDTLVIDGYFQEVLASPLLSSNDNEIQLHKDGSWSTPMIANEAQVLDTSKSKQKIEVISDDLEVITTEVEQKNTVKGEIGTSGVMHSLITIPATTSLTANNEPTSTTNNETVDLTLSDSDDDLPPRRSIVPFLSKNISSTSSSAVGANVQQKVTTTTTTTTGAISLIQTADCDNFSSSIISLDSPSPPSTPNSITENGAVTSTTTPICSLPSNLLQSGSHSPNFQINPLAVSRLENQAINSVAPMTFQRFLAGQSQVHSTNNVINSNSEIGEHSNKYSQ